MSEDRLVATHESAHATLACQFGFPVRRVTLHQPGRDDGAAGFCELHSWDIDAMRDPLRALMYLLAGGAAEAHLTGRPSTRDGGDREQAKALAALVSEEEGAGEADKALESAAVIVRALMHDPITWRAIERVAHELLKRRSLTGRDVQVIFREATT